MQKSKIPQLLEIEILNLWSCYFDCFWCPPHFAMFCLIYFFPTVSTIIRCTVYIIIALIIQSLSLSNICYRWSQMHVDTKNSQNINIAIYSGHARDQCSFFYPFRYLANFIFQNGWCMRTCWCDNGMFAMFITETISLLISIAVVIVLSWIK